MRLFGRTKRALKDHEERLRALEERDVPGIPGPTPVAVQEAAPTAEMVQGWCEDAERMLRDMDFRDIRTEAHRRLANALRNCYADSHHAPELKRMMDIARGEWTFR